MVRYCFEAAIWAATLCAPILLAAGTASIQLRTTSKTRTSATLAPMIMSV
jgi:hypothetical protein